MKIIFKNNEYINTDLGSEIVVVNECVHDIGIALLKVKNIF